MTIFPLGLESPGPRLCSTPQDRSPVRLMAIIAEHHHRGVARYQSRDVTGDGHAETFCNIFAQDVSEAMGAPLPRRMLANATVAWLDAEATRDASEWLRVDAWEAQRSADKGELAIAGWVNPAGGPGHLAVGVPSLGEAGWWVAQAGRTNFTRAPVASGFGVYPVSWFIHP